MPRPFLPTIAVAVATLSLTLYAQDDSPLFSLERIVELHSQQLDRLKSASIVYDVTQVVRPGQVKSETRRVIIDGPFEAYTTLSEDPKKPNHCWWDGTSFGRAMGFAVELRARVAKLG